jgi:hypothetical protein
MSDPIWRHPPVPHVGISWSRRRARIAAASLRSGYAGDSHGFNGMAPHGCGYRSDGRTGCSDAACWYRIADRNRTPSDENDRDPRSRLGPGHGDRGASWRGIRRAPLGFGHFGERFPRHSRKSGCNAGNRKTRLVARCWARVCVRLRRPASAANCVPTRRAALNFPGGNCRNVTNVHRLILSLRNQPSRTPWRTPASENVDSSSSRNFFRFLVVRAAPIAPPIQPDDTRSIRMMVMP